MALKKIVKIERLADVPSKQWRGRVVTDDGSSYELCEDKYSKQNFEHVIYRAYQKPEDLFLVEVNRGKLGIQIQGSEAAMNRFWESLSNKAPANDFMVTSGAKQVIDELAKRQQAQRNRT